MMDDENDDNKSICPLALRHHGFGLLAFLASDIPITRWYWGGALLDVPGTESESSW